MARQKVVPGGTLDIPSADEIVRLIPRPRQTTRMRAAASVQINNAGVISPQDVYKVPVGMGFEARRVVASLTGNAPADPVVNSLILGASKSVVSSSFNAAAANNVSLPAGVPATGFLITGAGATAGSVITVTLAGGVTGAQFFTLTIPAGAGTAINPLQVTFNPPIQALNPTSQITLSVPSFGAGNTNATVELFGTGGGPWLAYLRSGQLMEYAQFQYGSLYQIPGVQSWGDEQGPYVRNGEVLSVQGAGFVAGQGIVQLGIYLEGILSRPSSEDNA